MTDRKLLELAAMAYWGSEIDDVCSIRWLEEDQCIGYTHADNQDHNGNDVELCWNPLLDDGDAFRLAVKLKFTTSFDEYDGDLYATATKPHTHQGYDCIIAADPYKATRRAIVRAAAEVAKQEVKP